MKGIKRLLLSPPVPLLWINAILTLLLAACAVLLAVFPLDGALAVLSYVVYALAAISLFYSVWGFVRYFPRIRRGVGSFVARHAVLRELVNNFGYRTVVFSAIGFVVCVGYGVLNGVLGILSRSVWYGALAGYYILLAILRGTLFRDKDDPLREAVTYRRTGLLLLCLQLALSAAIAQMIFDGRAFSYPWEWMAIAAAAYAFYKVITAAINFVRAHRDRKLRVEAIRNINLADAAVSLLALQTSLLSVFGDGDGDSLFNTLTGSAVTLVTLSLGVFMLWRGNRLIKKYKMENANEGS